MLFKLIYLHYYGKEHYMIPYMCDSFLLYYIFCNKFDIYKCLKAIYI